MLSVSEISVYLIIMIIIIIIIIIMYCTEFSVTFSQEILVKMN